MVYKSKNKFFKFIDFAACSIIIILAISFYSCSDDNPVKTTQVSEFDSARFNWRTVPIPNHGFAGMWAQDTSNIFLLNNYDNSLYKESGGNVTIMNSGSYYLTDIKGLSNSEIYLFAESRTDYKLNIIRWNGSDFEAHPSKITITRNGRFIRGCAVNSNEVWTISNNGISKFDGVKMTDYVYADSLFDPNFLFLSNDNTLQYISSKLIDTSHGETALYEFHDSSFIKIYDYIVTEESGEVFLEVIGNYKYGLQLNSTPRSICIKNFTGTSFTDNFCFNNKIHSLWYTQPYNPVGINLQNFIILVTTDPGIYHSHYGIVHWDGNKTSKELMLHGFVDPVNYFSSYIIFCIDQNNYLILEPNGGFDQNNTLYIGTKK